MSKLIVAIATGVATLTVAAVGAVAGMAGQLLKAAVSTLFVGLLAVLLVVVAVAAIILVGLPEYFRELQEYRMLAFGMGMVLIMLWRPGGLLTHREPTIRTRPQPASA